MNKYAAGLAAVIIAVLIIGVATLPAAPADEATKKLYTAKCQMCHGPDGTGNTPAGKSMKARDFHAEDVQKQTDAQLVEVITKGRNKMPSFDKKITDAEIKSLAAYCRELGKKK
jgi:mono/diheme cytochrome c family protein